MDTALHLGAHRTASTTFQAYLGQNRKRLKEMGIACWSPRQTRDGRLEGLFRRPDRLTPLSERTADRSIGRLILQQRRLSKNGVQTLVVSEENLLGNMGLNLSKSSLYGDLRARLLRIKPGFKSRLSTVALTIRGYDTYWASVLGHRVLQGTPFPGQNALDKLVTQPRRWRHVIEDIAAVFPGVPLKVLPFERVAGRPEVVLASLVPDLTEFPRYGARGWHNPRRPTAMLQDIAQTRGDDSAIPLGKGEGKWHPFNELQSNAMRAQYQDDLAWLRSGADGLAEIVEDHGKIDFAKGAQKRRRQAQREGQNTHGREREVAGAVA